ncbi:LuxR C-terminal-related transcriptional regulator [Nocardia sp. NPDC004168]|uniref:LuxR C-terminal-related transcriptional regulator n=1 Tax=Nocardia sp. NPDC004168 TaxID=3154452 RepID=UPI0033AA7319
MAPYSSDHSTLPVATACFIGRERELETISTLILGSAQLVTLTGPGGIGKTRLAVEVVRRLHKAKDTPVLWVRLSRLTPGSDVMAVAEEIARSVTESDFSGRSVWEVLADTFSGIDARRRIRQSVLVLDSCEHVLVGAAAVITKLLDTVAGLTVIATSREPIGWVDEHLVTIPSLSHHNAIALFRKRAELTGHPITGMDETAMAAKICRRVHNHPLYIQLAAARLSHQTPAMVLHGLTGHADDARLRWSHGPRFGADVRHRGVSDVIAWSYALCSNKERLLFDRMSVFAAGDDTNPHELPDITISMGADLDAIEAICCDDETCGTDNQKGQSNEALARRDIEELLERLTAQSLITTSITSDTVFYSLTESLRVFAQHRLRQRSTVDKDEPARLRDRHCRYYRDKLAQAAGQWFTSSASRELWDWARAAWDNILTAIETSLTSPGDAFIGLEICVHLISMRMPFARGKIREMRRLTDNCLNATQILAPHLTQLQIAAMSATAWLALVQGLPGDAEKILQSCFAACLPGHDKRQSWRQTPGIDVGLPAPVEYAWGTELLIVRHDAQAITVFTRARDKFDALGDVGSAFMSEMYAAKAAALLGNAQQADYLTRDFLERAIASGSLWARTEAELARSIALTRHGNPAEALALERTALASQLNARDQWVGLWAVQYRIWSLAYIITDSINSENNDRAMHTALAIEISHLTGGLQAEFSRIGFRIDKLGPFAEESTKAVGTARQIIGPEAFAAEKARGSRLHLEFSEVQRLALGTLTFPEISKSHDNGKTFASPHWNQLTAAEREVAALAAAGWTNTAIAARRGTSVKTTNAQMAAILQKLIITSREEIIKYVPASRIDEVRLEAARRPRRTSRRPPQPM